MQTGLHGEACRQMEAESLPGLFRGSHSFSSMLDNGGTVAHHQLLVCHYHATHSQRPYSVNDMKGRGLLSRPCLDSCTDGHRSRSHLIAGHSQSTGRQEAFYDERGAGGAPWALWVCLCVFLNTPGGEGLRYDFFIFRNKQPLLFALKKHIIQVSEH